MKVESKRIFISDLPENVGESKILKKFSEYGEVSSVEIKHRKDNFKNQSPLFAFINIKIDYASLQKCFQDFASKKWSGSFVELQIAKESFLERLKREREETESSVANKPCEKDVEIHIRSGSDLYVNNNGVCNNVKKYNSSSDSESCDNFDNDSKVNNNQHSSGKNKRKEELDAIETFDDVDFIVKNNQNKVLEDKLTIESVGKQPIQIIEKAAPKSKDPKRAEADRKRMQSIIEMKKGYQQQKMLIKTALSKVDFKTTNKIVFDAQGNDPNVSKGEKRYSANRKTNLSAARAKSLFDDEPENDDKEFNFEVKVQFQGKRGQKLLELQSKYKNDKRFALDARFLEDEEKGEDERIKINSEEHEESCSDDEVDEKQKQLAILEEVLGKKVTSNKKDFESSSKQRKVMLRFDPTQPEHAKYEVKEPEKPIEQKKRKRKESENKEVDDRPIASKEKFYKVTENLKDTFQEKESFSLLNMFGKSETADTKEDAEDHFNEVESVQKRKNFEDGNNPFKYDSSDNEFEDAVVEENKAEGVGSNEQVETKAEKVVLGPSRLWTEPLFFRNDDYRFQEGIDFIKKLEADEVLQFSKVRRDLKMIMRTKVRNNERRNKPFKNKLGGRKKMLRIKKALKR